MNVTEKTYTAEQLAKRYHRTIDTVNRWVRRGFITALNPCDGLRSGYIFRLKDIEEFEERATVGGSRPLKGREKR